MSNPVTASLALRDGQPILPDGIASELFLLREFWNAWNEMHSMAARHREDSKAMPRRAVEQAGQRLADRAQDYRNWLAAGTAGAYQ